MSGLCLGLKGWDSWTCEGERQGASNFFDVLIVLAAAIDARSEEGEKKKELLSSYFGFLAIMLCIIP